MTDLVEVRGLTIVVGPGAGVPIVSGVDFSVAEGEIVALIGESGSGKTTIALSLLGYTREGCRVAGGTIRVGDIDVLALDEKGLAAIRGTKVAYVAQSAAAAFNPAHTIMEQVVESGLIHGVGSRAELETKAIDLFRSLALPDPTQIGNRYPHQVSGGQLQRVMAAMALITDPVLVVFDEPTTALDVTTQIEVLRAFKTAVRERHVTAVYVSHDLAVVAQMADRIVVLSKGVIRETGTTVQVLDTPSDSYTRTLMAAARPVAAASAVAPEPREPLLAVRGLVAGYGGIGATGLPRSAVLTGIDLEVRRGTTLGVIGESGSGKSTLARVIAGLVPAARGTLLFDGAVLPATLERRTREQFRRIQIVFQDADTALNPAHTIGRILGRPLELYHGLRGDSARARIARLLDLVHLPSTLAERYPSELSGGQKQRINLARALAAEPDLILCDEVTSALDTVVAAAILELIAEVRRELGLACLFISHDISTVRAICDEVVVLYSGQIVESGSRNAMRAPPFHPYTGLLVASVPEMRPGWLERVQVAEPLRMGPVADAGSPSEAAMLCPFLARCPQRIDGTCNVLPPPRTVSATGKEILCHLSAAGVLTRAIGPTRDGVGSS
jgi:peptide/nickel transport system ATP-binding protein